MVDSALALAGLLFGAHIASLALAWRKCRRTVPASPPRGRISLVRPVCGLESYLRETLASSFIQTHPDFEVIFCIAREDDPAANMVRELMDAHPKIPAQLLIGEARLSSNPKLNNMAKGWTHATGDFVVFADSNLLLPHDYCVTVAAAFADGDVVVASAPPVGDFPENFWGEVECAMLNTHAARWQFAAAAMGMNFAQGKTLAYRRSAFDANLMAELAAEPAEDAATTKIVRSMGAKMVVVAPPFVHPVGPRSAQAFWGRHVRWARLRRATFTATFAAEALCGVFPCLLALALSRSIPTVDLPAIVAGAIALWYGCEYLVAKRLGWRANHWFLPACLMRDAMLPAFFIAGWAGRRFEWRGHAMQADATRSAA